MAEQTLKERIETYYTPERVAQMKAQATALLKERGAETPLLQGYIARTRSEIEKVRSGELTRIEVREGQFLDITPQNKERVIAALQSSLAQTTHSLGQIRQLEFIRDNADQLKAQALAAAERLGDLGDKAVMMVGSEACPACQRHAPLLKELEQRFPGVNFKYFYGQDREWNPIAENFALSHVLLDRSEQVPQTLFFNAGRFDIDRNLVGGANATHPTLRDAVKDVLEMEIRQELRLPERRGQAPEQHIPGELHAPRFAGVVQDSPERQV